MAYNKLIEKKGLFKQRSFNEVNNNSEYSFILCYYNGQLKWKGKGRSNRKLYIQIQTHVHRVSRIKGIDFVYIFLVCHIS